MKNISFKSDPKYSHRTYAHPLNPAIRVPFPSRYFERNYATERQPGSGLRKKDVKFLPAGIHVMFPKDEKPKLIKKAISDAYGSVLTSTKKAIQKHHNRKFRRK